MKRCSIYLACKIYEISYNLFILVTLNLIKKSLIFYDKQVHQDIKCVESDLADLMSKNAEVQTQAKAYKDEIAELTKVRNINTLLTISQPFN